MHTGSTQPAVKMKLLDKSLKSPPVVFLWNLTRSRREVSKRGQQTTVRTIHNCVPQPDSVKCNIPRQELLHLLKQLVVHMFSRVNGEKMRVQNVPAKKNSCSEIQRRNSIWTAHKFFFLSWALLVKKSATTHRLEIDDDDLGKSVTWLAVCFKKKKKDKISYFMM